MNLKIHSVRPHEGHLEVYPAIQFVGFNETLTFHFIFLLSLHHHLLIYLFSLGSTMKGVCDCELRPVRA